MIVIRIESITFGNKTFLIAKADTKKGFPPTEEEIELLKRVQDAVEGSRLYQTCNHGQTWKHDPKTSV